MQKIVLLTSGSWYGEKIAKRLLEKGIPVSAIVYILPLTIQECKRLYPGYNGMNPIHAAKLTKHLIGKFFLKRRILKQYSKYTKSIYFNGQLNSIEMESLLKKLDYDFLLLGGTGILKENIINTAKKGVLNSHPGLLPWARGTGVVGCSIQRSIAIGCTVHFVNKGIDLGPIITRKLLRIENIETSLAELEKKNDELAIELMVEVVEKYIMNNQAFSPKIQTEKFEMCRWLNPTERAREDENIKEGKAFSLFQQWKTKCEEETLELIEDRAK